MKKIYLLLLLLTTYLGAEAFNVTFSVDMQNVTGFTTPTVNGSFDGWCGNCHPMTDANADGIWEVTFDMPAGNYEYKFANDNWNGEENLTPGSICTLTSGAFTNRIINVTSDTVLPTVCWGRCYACGVATPNHDVTFQVDMQNVTGFNTPEVKGSFNGWCSPTCNPMSDANNDNIWEVTVTIPEGNYEYKFAYDNWTGQENLTPGSSCTKTTDIYTNRTLAVTETSTLPVVCWESCSACPGPPVFVTFQVDMSNVTGFTTPYLIGTFNGWCGNCNPLTDVGNGIWEIMMSLSAGDYEYKFTYDNGAGSESLTQGSSCTITSFGYTNRKVTVESSDIELGVVCWGSCASCGGVVTDPCDLLTLAFDDASSLTNWSTVADATLPEASMTWDASGALRISGSNTSTDIGKAYIFQYLNNAVNYNSNSTVQLDFDVKSVGTLVGTALQLQTEIPGAGVVNTNNLETAGINENTWTHYSYTFNGVTAASLFRMHFNMAAGGFFGAGGTLLIDNIELNCYTPLVIAGCTDATALNYNAAATEDDGSCTYPVTYNVTFQVDMNNSGLSNASLNGTFNSWCNGCNAMTDANADGVWEITIPLAAGTYEYKFASGSGNGATWENLVSGSSCTVTNFGFTNRSLVVTGDVTIPTVCFGSCLSCNQAPPTYPVIFQVDMQNVTGFTTPTVNGSFDGFCGNCHPMTDANSDGIWETTLNLEAGDYEYKFAYDSWAGQEELTPGSPCTLTTGIFTNRTLAVSAASTLPVVCWGSCSECGSTATPVDVTFQVDMSQYIGSFTTPEVNGTFNNWCGGCAPMSDLDGNNIWELTIPLIPGTYEYKFAYDDWLGQENLVDGSTCTITLDGFTNRVITVIDAETLPAVCWESCTLCPDFVNENSNTISVYPNPSNGNIRINSNLALPYNVEVFDLSGRKVQDMKVFQSNTEINLENLAKGAYQIRVSNNYNSVRETVIIK